MKGKQPKSVMTDGDLAMKSVVSTVFPVHITEVDKFERIWMDSVAKFGLKNHPWIADMYARKHSWSNAHIRGKFFVGLKTTSRCKALNMQIGKFIHNGYNLREFVEYFQHYLEFM
ncbi:hypothetical protein AHAS_Ahas15G0145100 [Arachis hypogaea]